MSKSTLVGPSEAARELGMTPRGVRELIHRGELPAQKLGKEFAIERKDLETVREPYPVGRPRGSSLKKEK
jgi:excisionase family DNA binding protein